MPGPQGRFIVVPSLDPASKTAKAMAAVAESYGVVETFHLSERGDNATPSSGADMKRLQEMAERLKPTAVLGHSLGSHLALRLFCMKPRLACAGFWFAPVVDAEARLAQTPVPAYLREARAYLAAHCARFQPADLVPSLRRLVQGQTFVFGRHDGLRIQGEDSRIQEAMVGRCRVAYPDAGHFFARSHVEAFLTA